MASMDLGAFPEVSTPLCISFSTLTNCVICVIMVAMYNKFKIKGCVGFSYISGRLCGDMILVRGKNTISVSLIWPLYYILSRLWRSKNILEKILFD